MKSRTLIIGGVIFSLVILVSSYFFLAGGQNQTVKIASYTTQDKERPKAEVKSSFSDMGTIKVSEQKEAEFTIKNVGSKPLQLSNISSSCGCTVGQVVYDGKTSQEFGMHSQSDLVAEVAPQKTAKLKVTYRPYVMPVYGVVEREVYVSTNDPDNPKLVFKVKAYVR